MLLYTNLHFILLFISFIYIYIYIYIYYKSNLKYVLIYYIFITQLYHSHILLSQLSSPRTLHLVFLSPMSSSSKTHHKTIIIKNPAARCPDSSGFIFLLTSWSRNYQSPERTSSRRKSSPRTSRRRRTISQRKEKTEKWQFLFSIFISPQNEKNWWELV